MLPLLAMRTQFNVRVGKAIKKRVLSDRKSFGATNDIIVEVALENFFSRFTPDQRATFYKNHYYAPYRKAA